MNDDLMWFKSSYSDSGGGDCVEIAVRPDTSAVLVRDSKRRDEQLALAPTSWSGFLRFAVAQS